MKIVQFRDGTFGLRRWSWSLLGYKFHDNNFIDFWWEVEPRDRSDKNRYKFAHVYQVKEMHNAMLAARIKTKRDRGTKIKGPEQI